MPRKILSLTILAALLVSALAGCSSSGSSATADPNDQNSKKVDTPGKGPH